MNQPLAIDAATLRRWLEEERPVTILDVRPLAEREEWQIPGSTHLDIYAKLKANEPHAVPDNSFPENIPLVTVCAAGKMSQRAAEQLARQGYKVYSLTGGMKAWSLAWNTALVPTVLPEVTILQIRRTGKGCLSYMVAVQGEAIVIDASLEIGVYQELAVTNNWHIKYVLDTHLHADHLSRSRVLAQQVKAALYLPYNPRLSYAYNEVTEQTRLNLNGISLTVIPTPGHTLDSVSYLLGEQVLFTGDTLFRDAVGRPDLKTNPAEAEKRARLLYASVSRLFQLPDEVVVLPGHTSKPVPFDSKPIAQKLGLLKEKLLLLKLPEEAFVSTILSRIPATPPNYQTISELNLSGEISAVEPSELEAGANRCAIA